MSNLLAEVPAGRGPIWTVLPGQLYMSGTWRHWPADRAAERLRQLAPLRVINLGQRTQPHLENSTAAYEYWVVPDSRLRVHPDIPRVAQVAASAIRGGERVLIMCHGGRNRSGLVVALTLCELRDCTGAAALAAVRRARGRTALNNQLFCEYLLSSRGS